MGRGTVGLVVCCLVALTAGCANLDGVVAKGERSAKAFEEARRDAEFGRQTGVLIAHASLTVETSDITEAAALAETSVEEAGGFVGHRLDRDGRVITMTLRVPAAKLKDTLAALEALGDVTERSSSKEDVTEQYIDLKARLKNKTVLRDRMRKLLDKTQDVKQILDIEKELARVQTEIDSIQGQLDAMKQMSDFATIHLTLRRSMILGPLGFVVRGIGWTLEKLFIIRR